MSNQENINNDLIPLKQWYCDSCGEVISKPEDGWLEWYTDVKEFNNGKGYRIVHHEDHCMYDQHVMYKQKKSVSDMHLDYYMGPDGLVNLLSYIDFDRVEKNSELVDIIRRLHVPYYEEARKYHPIAEAEGFFSGENEASRYLQNTSKHILKNFKQRHFY